MSGRLGREASSHPPQRRETISNLLSAVKGEAHPEAPAELPARRVAACNACTR